VWLTAINRVISMSAPSNYDTETGLIAWVVKAIWVVIVDGDRDGNFVVVPGYIANSDHSVIADLNGSKAIFGQFPQAIDNLYLILNIFGVLPVGGKISRPNVSGLIVNYYYIFGNGTLIVSGSQQYIIIAIKEVCEWDFDAEIAWLV
jgi:hypothetical protein